MPAAKEYTGTGKTPGTITFGQTDSPSVLVGTGGLPAWFDDGGNIVIDFSGIASGSSGLIRDSTPGSTKFMQITFDLKMTAVVTAAVEICTMRNASAKISNLLIGAASGSNNVRPRGGGDAAITGWTTATTLTTGAWYRVRIALEVATTSTGKTKAELIRLSDGVTISSGESTNLNNGTANTSFHQSGKAGTSATMPLQIDNVAFDWVAYSFLDTPVPPSLAPTVNTIEARSVRSLATVVTTATVAAGTVDSWAFAQTSGPAVALTGTGATRSFRAPATYSGADVVISVTATKGGVASEPVAYSVNVKPHQHWYRSASAWVPRIGTHTT